MKRRKLLIGLGGTAAGASTLVGTGAFTNINANRDVLVAVADDPNALLGFEACDSPNSDYATFPDGPNGGGVLELDISEDNEAVGNGVNDDAVTVIHDVFRICNNGTEEACVWLNLDPLEVDGQKAITFYFGDDEGSTFEGPDDSLLLEPGECTPCISLTVDTTFDWGQDSPLNPVHEDYELVVNANVGEGPCFVQEPTIQCGQSPENGYEDQGVNGNGNDVLPERSCETSVAEMGDFDYVPGQSEDYATDEFEFDGAEGECLQFFSLGFDPNAVVGESSEPASQHSENEYAGGSQTLYFEGNLPANEDLVIYEATNGDRNEYGHEMAQVYALAGESPVHVGTATSRGSDVARNAEPTNPTGRNEFQLPDDEESYNGIVLVDDSNPDDFDETETADGFDVEYVEACVESGDVGT